MNFHKNKLHRGQNNAVFQTHSSKQRVLWSNIWKTVGSIWLLVSLYSLGKDGLSAFTANILRKTKEYFMLSSMIIIFLNEIPNMYSSIKAFGVLFLRRVCIGLHPCCWWCWKKTTLKVKEHFKLASSTQAMLSFFFSQGAWQGNAPEKKVSVFHCISESPKKFSKCIRNWTLSKHSWSASQCTEKGPSTSPSTHPLRFSSTEDDHSNFIFKFFQSAYFYWNLIFVHI